MRVHITLDDDIREDADAMDAVLGRLLAEGLVWNVDRASLERSGIITCDTDEESMTWLTVTSGVKAVERDGRKDI